MDQFKQKAIEEAHELISGLEDSLLVLENDSDDKDNIAKVFRIMHTLKGNSAMFGFNYIAEFTHHIESIYDLVRNDKLKLNKDIFDITLFSVDHLKILLEDINLENASNKKSHTDFLNKLIDFVKKINTLLDSGAEFIDLDEGKEKEKKPTKEKKVKKAEKETEEEKVEVEKIEEKVEIPAEPVKKQEEKICSFIISFKPVKEILQTGSNPLYLLDDLNNLGKCKTYVEVKDIPSLDNLNPITCHVAWKIILSTKETVNSIKDVFIFVESDCTIDINLISEDDVFNRADFDDYSEQLLSISERSNILETEFTFRDSIEHEEQKKSEEEDKCASFQDVQQTGRKQVANKESITSIRVSSERLDVLMNLVSELVTTQARLSLFAESNVNSELSIVAENVQKLTRQLRDIAFSICLIPIQNILTRFHRLVRDLSTELNKEVELFIEGSETELDKSIIESLSDPIMHILRNSLDHGIEDAAVRLKAGKPAKGTILIKAYYSGANVIIKITDDGAGIDLDKVKNKAISKGLVPSDANLSRKYLLELLFLPGFSTAEKVTGVSGRGVGMDVVRRKIMDIRGEVDVDTKLGHGTSITIKLPLTLSIIDGLLVSIDGVCYIISLSVIDKCYAVMHSQVMTAYNNVIILDGVQVPFYYMREEFDSTSQAPDMEQVIVVRYEESKVGIVIDKVIGEYQAVLKPLGKMYKEQDMISGASILGDGTIALVLDTNKIIKKFTKQEMA